MRHGGRILADQLAIQGVDTVFCVPGESYLAALDGLYDIHAIRTIVCRQEGGAAYMAEAYGKLTGRPGICFVTRGPGASNASIGVHVARQDSTPMILFVGLPPTPVQDREAFQEFDLKAVFGALGKWAAVVPSTERLPEYVSHAFHAACSARPGPVVLGLPEDVLAATADVADARAANASGPSPDPADMAVLGATLAKAERPLMIVGGPGWSTATKQQLERVASAADLPVTVAFRYQDYFDNHHPSYAGHVGIGIDPRLAERVRSADVLIAVGARLGEMTTGGYTHLEVPNPEQFLVHVHPDGDELGSVYRADLPINATSAAFVRALEDIGPLETAALPDWRAGARDDYEGFIEPRLSPGTVKMEQVATMLRDLLPGDAIIANGAGNYAAWVHRYHLYRHHRCQLATTAGSMGYGLPAAIAAKLVHPERTVVAFAGDGCFLMNGQEMATAMQYGLHLVVVVVNNGMYGTIRMHQERTYPGRVMATSLVNPDFAAMARSFGAHGEVVEHTVDFQPALERALAADTLALIELRTDPQALSPTATLDEIRGE